MVSVKIPCGYDAGEKTASHSAIASVPMQEIGSSGNAAQDYKADYLTRTALSKIEADTAHFPRFVGLRLVEAVRVFCVSGLFFWPRVKCSAMILCSHSPP